PINHQQGIYGIVEFMNSVEFHYFSQVKLKSNHTTKTSLHLVLEITCNLELIELFAHLNTGRWGHSESLTNPLLNSLLLLNSKNNAAIDIEELTLFLNDTSIVIKRIHERSVATQFHEILGQIASNYVFLTRGLTQKPFEIFVPIFEDTFETEELVALSIENAPKTYDEFWGVYLDNEEEAAIYDVSKNSYVHGNLEFLTD
ncbi:MAG: hypothetical protein WA810_15955, partial [Maribacter sp.]